MIVSDVNICCSDRVKVSKATTKVSPSDGYGHGYENAAPNNMQVNPLDFIARRDLLPNTDKII
jgi:hypothetical protein